MYSQSELTKAVFFDLETAAEYESLDLLLLANKKKAELWSKRCDYLRLRFEENKYLTDEELYVEKAALTPEFARIVCATFARLSWTEEGPSLIVKSYSSDSEIEVLEGIHKVFEKFFNLKFVGHNIKRFDVPMMCKRLLINGYSLPKGLLIHNLKPWEMPFIDTSEVWSFGAWQEGFTSLDLLATSIGLDSPKEEIQGSEVNSYFWKGEIEKITKYCERDVMTTTNILLKLSGLSIVKDYAYQA
jgi:DNA polymerase elongation subunit (family B)|tara:strand:- start:1078 stop:1809 length:732 start_codon:yes stop_codon:yes gene_type:complete